MAGSRCDDLTLHAQRTLLSNRLRIACDMMAEAEIDVLIEPLNSQDMSGYFIDSFPLAESIIQEVGKKISVYSLIFTTVRKFMAMWQKILNATSP